jgi:threonine/homoserine/homoserine lactone efflux protein
MLPSTPGCCSVSACVALVATPGPSILYLVSRTLAQGRAAGFVSLAGRRRGSLARARRRIRLSALLSAVPLAYEVVAGWAPAYLAWLAFVTWRTRDPAARRSRAGAAARGAALRRVC